jgi:flagellar basal-body rod protein FlgF
MENTLYIALSRQMVMQRHMEVIANNIANMSTPGFKGEQMLFVEYLGTMDSGETVSYVQDLAVVRDFGEGALTHTGNALDVAIHGSGWLVVDTPDGQRYTRNGHLSLDQNGRIVTSEGYAVLDRNGQPITLGPEDSRIVISGDGTIATNGGPKGRLNIVTFEDEQQLRKESGSLYTTDAPAQPALRAQVVQGMIEGANVEPIIEVTNMIWALRNYQAAQQLIEGDDGLLRRAIDTLTQQQPAA